MNEILFRLILGNKVVGYEKHEDGGVNYGIEILHGVALDFDFSPVLEKHGHIKHDRKDRYTGVEINSVKVFEGDEFEFMYPPSINSSVGKVSGVIVRDRAKFLAVYTKEGKEAKLDFNYFSESYEYKLRGIEGVTT